MTTNLQPGDRIELLAMPEDPDPIPTGTTGTVVSTNPSIEPGHIQVIVDWDVKRSLNLAIPPDEVRVINDGAAGGSP